MATMTAFQTTTTVSVVPCNRFHSIVGSIIIINRRRGRSILNNKTQSICTRLMLAEHEGVLGNTEPEPNTSSVSPMGEASATSMRPTEDSGSRSKVRVACSDPPSGETKIRSRGTLSTPLTMMATWYGASPFVRGLRLLWRLEDDDRSTALLMDTSLSAAESSYKDTSESSSSLSMSAEAAVLGFGSGAG